MATPKLSRASDYDAQDAVRGNRRIAPETSAAVYNMRRLNSWRFGCHNIVAFGAFCAITAMLAVFFFQRSPPPIAGTKLNGCGDKAHLRGPWGTKGEGQWIYDIYLEKNFIAAKYVGRTPPDQNQPGESKSARIKSYACDSGNFTMTEVESSDNMDCTYSGAIMGEEISGAYYCPISGGGLLSESSTSNFKLDDQDRECAAEIKRNAVLADGRRMPEAPGLILGLPFPARGEGRPLGGFATPNVMVLQIQWLMGSNRDGHHGVDGPLFANVAAPPTLRP
jgi:hypothetical protein